MKQGKQAANPLSFPCLNKFRALLTREGNPEARISGAAIPVLRAFPTAPAGAGPGAPRPHALRFSRHRETARASRAKRAGQPVPRDSRGGARARRRGPLHLSRAPGGGGGLGETNGGGGPHPSARALPAAEASPSQPCSVPSPLRKAFIFRLCQERHLRGGAGRGVRACLLPPTGGTWRLPQRRPLLQPGALVTQLHP